MHQFTRIGRHAFVAGGSMVVMDVPPFCIAQGDRAELVGVNSVGLARHGFTEEQIARVKEAYRILFRSKLPLEEAVERHPDRARRIQTELQAPARLRHHQPARADPLAPWPDASA